MAGASIPHSQSSDCRFSLRNPEVRWIVRGINFNQFPLNDGDRPRWHGTYHGTDRLEKSEPFVVAVDPEQLLSSCGTFTFVVCHVDRVYERWKLPEVVFVPREFWQVRIRVFFCKQQPILELLQF